MSTIKAIPELDGLRGLAILIVLVYHFVNIHVQLNGWVANAINNFFIIGWAGVDIFFVLSGFLITSILIKTKTSQTYFRSFYIKRVLRIFPLYYLYLAFVFFIFIPFYGHRLSQPEQLNFSIAKHSELYFWLYISNIKQFFQQNFFGAALGHIWSLSIEEQFYLIWPVIVYYCNFKQLRKILVVIFIVSIVLRAICYYHGVNGFMIYSFTFTRMDSLAYGAFIAILLQKPLPFNRSRIKLYLKILFVVNALLFIFFGPWPNSSSVMLIFGYSIISISTALLILILQAPEPSKLKIFFNRRLLKFLGKYSYALYLLNPIVRQACLKLFPAPFLVWGSNLTWNFLFIGACLIVSIIMAVLSWNLFEKWFMKIKARYEKKQIEQLITNTDKLVANSF